MNHVNFTPDTSLSFRELKIKLKNKNPFGPFQLKHFLFLQQGIEYILP